LHKEVVIAARGGDEIAFQRLVDQEAARVYRGVLAVVRSPEDAQDVMQEAIIRAWRHLGDLSDVDSWPGWFRKIAIRQAFDQARRRKGRRAREVPIEDPQATMLAHQAPAWDERVAVLAALQRLSADDRVLLGLRFGADLTVPQVAEAAGLRLPAAKSRLYRAIARLAKEMEGFDDGG